MRQLELSRRCVTAGLASCVLSISGFPRLLASQMRHPFDQWTDIPFLTGVNLAGAEFGDEVPGAFGTDYTYPSCNEAMFYRSLGFNVVRLPFLWERMQPELFGKFDPVEWERLRTFLNCALNKGLYVILDPHNYAKRRIKDDGFSRAHSIGSLEVPVEAYLQFWIELSKRTPSQQIVYGLMNEPADTSAQAWFDIAQKCVLRIREFGARNLILAPGSHYTGAHSWRESGNEILASLDDPFRLTAIEVHQYFDADSSGTRPDAVSPTIGVDRIETFEDWARRNKCKAFLGEFGPSTDPVNLRALRNLLEHISDNRDVWIGWTAWAAGPWWPDDFAFKLDYLPSTEIPPQTRVLVEFARKR